MQRSDRYTLLYAAAVCVACSAVLSATSFALKKQQDLQVELDRKANILKAFGARAAGADIQRLFDEHVREIALDRETGQPAADAADGMPLYLWEEGGRTTKYAFPVSGKGLWSTIHGYLALEEDLVTIAGATFYRHGETPGLGGEISSDAFQQQFRGKRIFKEGALQRLEIAKGPASNKYPGGSDHAVDGISGATLTGNGLNRFLNEDLERYERYFRTIRKG